MPGTQPLKTLVVLINWHQEDTTLQTIRAVHAEHCGGVDVMVVDNEATDFSTAFFADVSRELAHYKALDQNSGFTGACNIGLETAYEAGYDLVMWLNNDLELGPEAISRSVAFMTENPEVGMCSPVICDEETREPHFFGAIFKHDKLAFHFLTAQEAESSNYQQDVYLYGTALLARVDKAHSVNGFPKGYFIYWEDINLSHAFLDCGWACRMVPDAQVFHQNLHDEDDDMVRSKYYHYYMTRNALHFFFSSFSFFKALKISYWHYAKSVEKSKKLASMNKMDEAFAIRQGLKDALFRRTGRWSMHPEKR